MQFEVNGFFSLYYWPKLVAALYFSFMNAWIMTKMMKRKNTAWLFVALFFASYSFISIPAGYFFTEIYERIGVLFGSPGVSLAVHVIWIHITDYLIILIGMLIYSKITGLEFARSATVYLQYVCLEHLCMVLSVSAVSFFILYAVFQTIFFYYVRKDLEFMTYADSINWKRQLVYLCGLLFILETLYSSYYIFTELRTGRISFAMIWVDAVALITSGLLMGLLNLSIGEGKLNYSKIRYMKQFQEGQEHIIQTFAEISEAKSGETGQHVRRVAEYSKLIAITMQIDEKEADCLRIAAMMHDVGKLLIPKEIIEKPGKLTPEEFEIVKAHTVYGDQLLSKSDGDIIKMARVIAVQHHERWDGSGYPKGLHGDEIDLYAQIVSVADVYDALSSKRSYKDEWIPEDAKREIITQKGRQFAPGVVDAFLSVYQRIEEMRIRYKDD